MIEYKGTPLFGEGSSVSHTSEFFAIAGTILFWLLFLIFSFVIKAQPKKPEYKEVQIVLSSTPVVQKTEEAPAPAEAASAESQSEQTQPVVETPPAPAVKETPKPAPKKVETPKNTTKKTETPKLEPKTSTTQAPAPTPIYKTNEQLLEEQLKNNKIPKEYYDPWANEKEEDVLPQDENRREVKTLNTISGIAGDASIEENNGRISSEQRTDKVNNNVTQSDYFDTIRNANGSDISDTGKGITSDKLKGSDNDSLIWTEGSGRSLPKIDIVLSDEAKYSMLITKETHFKISFSVDSEGNVIVSTIIIEKEAMLTSIIKNEVRQNVSKWKFGPGNGISKAQFDWILRPEN